MDLSVHLDLLSRGEAIDLSSIELLILVLLQRRQHVDTEILVLVLDAVLSAEAPLIHPLFLTPNNSKLGVEV